MSKERREEVYKSYPIPYNFIDESKMFGGLVKTRNFIEGCICGALASIPVFLIPSNNFKLKIILFIVLVTPALVLGCVGINGDPISRFIMYYVKFKKSKRVVSFNNKVKLYERIDVDSLTSVELPRDKILKLLNNLGAIRENADEEEILNADDIVFDDDLEETKKKEEEARKMLKASEKYTKNTTTNEEYLNTLSNYSESSNALDNYRQNAVDINNSDKDDFSEDMADIDIYDGNLSSGAEETDETSYLISDDETVENEIDLSSIDMEDEDIVLEEAEFITEDEIIMLSGDFIDDYKETKIINTEPTENKSTENKSNDHPKPHIPVTQANPENTKPVQTPENTPVNASKKKKIILPWICNNCGTKNLSDSCSKCGNSKP
jgi:hypothetical protein